MVRVYRKTVDDDEVEFFNKLSSNWWDREGTMKYLYALNELRVPFIVDSLTAIGSLKKEYKDTDKPLTGLNGLDIGCGGTNIFFKPFRKPNFMWW